MVPAENPAILSIPLGFVGAILGTLVSREPPSQDKFNELLVEHRTGRGEGYSTLRTAGGSTQYPDVGIIGSRRTAIA